MDHRSPGVKYALRFGEIAVEKGFISVGQLQEALSEQLYSDSFRRLRPARLVGEILVERGWMTVHQIDSILEELLND